MGRNTIDLDKINARLGDLSKPRVRDPYEDDPDFVPRGERADDEYEDEDKPLGNVTFYSCVIGLFLLIGGGTFFSSDIINFYSTYGQKSDFVSLADPICKQFWASPGVNPDALTCYLVERPDRYCDPKERSHLVSLFSKYRQDLKAYQSAALGDFMLHEQDTFDTISSDLEHDGEPGYKLKTVNGPPVKPHNKYMKDVTIEEQMKIFQKQVFDPSSRDSNPDISAALRKILVQGYFDPSEFGYFPDRFVKDAYAEPFPVVKPPCASQ